MSNPRRLPLPPQVLKAASKWFVEFNEREVSVSQREEFVEWLRASPENVRAYVQVSAHWEEGRCLGRNEALTVEELMELGCSDTKALPLDHESGSLFLPERGQGAVPMGGSLSRLNGMLALAASMAVLVASFWVYERRSVYDTNVGEQRSIKLADGSTVDLNSDSQVRVVFTSAERGIELIQGQALFSVAKESARPFVVRSGDTRVKALGTRFDMYKRAAGTVVTVVEGRVAVINESMDAESSGLGSGASSLPQQTAAESPAPATHSAVELSSGQQTTVTSKAVKQPAAVDVDAATAWTQKQIIFRDTPLTEVVDEFNRYNTRKMRITDSAIQALRISGSFSSTDPASLLRALDTMGPFAIHENSKEVRISRR